nr:uncharacterized protein LOC123858559 [Mirounga angustirostris]
MPKTANGHLNQCLKPLARLPLRPGSHLRAGRWGRHPQAPHPPGPALQLRKGAPACSVPRRSWLPGRCSCLRCSARSPRTPCPRAAARRGTRALLPLGSPSATACVRDPWPEEGFRSRAEPGPTQPDTFLGSGECKGGEARESGSGRARPVAARRWPRTLLLGGPGSPELGARIALTLCFPSPPPLISESLFSFSYQEKPGEDSAEPRKRRIGRKSLAGAGSSPWFNGLLEARTGHLDQKMTDVSGFDGCFRLTHTLSNVFSSTRQCGKELWR